MIRGVQAAAPLSNGTRVRNYGQQYPRAIRYGTGYITGHFWNGPHLEYVVQLDDPCDLTGRTIKEWPADMTIRAD